MHSGWAPTQEIFDLMHGRLPQVLAKERQGTPDDELLRVLRDKQRQKEETARRLQHAKERAESRIDRIIRKTLEARQKEKDDRKPFNKWLKLIGGPKDLTKPVKPP
jgi:hypothetical protein